MDTIKHLVHANSNSIINGKPKQPADTRIRYGELAVNYKKGSETIFIKNDEDEISSFSNDTIIKQQLDDTLLTKQDILVNGENIKSINGHSLIGSGAIELPIPTKTSELVNDSGYQTLSEVEILINNELSKFDKLDYEIVTTLPPTGVTGVRYLVKHSTDNRYEEYIYVNDQWYDIGATDEVNLSEYYTKTETDTLLDVKINKDDYATDIKQGVIKLNSNEDITVNADGQLVVGGRCGQFPDGGIYYPNNVNPTKVGNYSLSISEATGLSCAHRNFILAGGTNVNLIKVAQAGATEYRISNTQSNRFFCSAFVGGRLAVDEASAKTKTVAITSVKFANGTDIKPYYGNTENSNDIIITVSETLNPSSTLSKVRGYGKWDGSDALSVGQGNRATIGKILQIGQAQVSNGASQNIMTGIRNYSTANSTIIVGADNINNKQYCCLFGQGHTTQDTGNGVALFGMWSKANSNTLFALGNGTSHNARSNILEVINDNGATGIILKSPNNTKYKLTVDDDGTLKTTLVT